jgi:hypothetical protein
MKIQTKKKIEEHHVDFLKELMVNPNSRHLSIQNKQQLLNQKFP